MKELWKPIPQYEQWYEVSNLGRIKVLAHDIVANRHGTPCTIHRVEKILDPAVAASVGCRICTLTNRTTQKSTYVKIYHIVAKVFNGLEPEAVVRKDGDVSNDCADNLIEMFSLLHTNDREWRAIPGYEGLYEISSLGEIFSLGRLASYGSSHSIRKPAKLLKYSIDEDGYFGVGLWNNEGECRQFRVNRLVAMTFLPNPTNLPIVNHKDGNKQNNCVENLEWCSVKYNTFEAYRIGLNNASLPIPVICLNNNVRFESIQAAADWVGCDHENINHSIRIKSCCKGGYCFVKEAEYPEDAVKYLTDAQKVYTHNKKFSHKIYAL